jgi:type IV pilus assembly protein PilF
MPAWLLALWLVAALAGCAGRGASPGSDGSAGPGQSAGSASALPESSDESESRRRARIRLELAATYYQQGNYTVAIDELRQALTIDPNYPAAHGMLGLVYMDLNDRPRAEESFQRALRLAPNDSDLNNNYGWYLCQTGRPAQAIERFLIALRNPLYATPSRPLHNAGICSLRAGDEKAAEDYFQRAFQVDPRNPVAMFQLAELNLKRNDYVRARFYSQRLMGAFDPSAEVLWQAIRIEHRAGNADGRESLAAQLRRRFPTSREASLLAAGRYAD